MININNSQSVSVDLESIKKQASIALDSLGYADFDLGILLVDEKTMQQYNLNFRQKDKVTDILSFPYHTELKAGDKILPESDDDKNLGDIIICPQFVNDDLERWQKTFTERMQILLVHGICHLLGYDHIEDEDYVVMKQLEEKLLTLIN